LTGRIQLLEKLDHKFWGIPDNLLRIAVVDEHSEIRQWVAGGIPWKFNVDDELENLAAD
jgi:hypothetical protein